MRCARGAKRWGRRPSSAPAAGCFRKHSRRRRCCGHGCGGWTRWACKLDAASPLDRLGRARPPAAFKRRTDRAPSKPRATVLALGGGSWLRGSELDLYLAWAQRSPPRCQHIAVAAGHSGFTVAWPSLSRPLRRPAAQGRCASFGSRRPRRSHRDPHRNRGRRDLRAVGRLREMIGSRGGDPQIAVGPTG